MNFLTPEVQKVALSLMAGLDCPRSLTVAILMRYEEWEQLVSLECSASAYLTADAYYRAVQATDLVRKLNSRIPGVDVEQATFDKWLAAEKMCYNTNRRFNEISDFGTLSGLPVDLELTKFLSKVRKNVETIIGAGPPDPFEGRFGPGATVSDDSRRTTVLHKLSSVPTVTSSACYYLVPWAGSAWARGRQIERVDLVRGNHYFSVPKTAKVGRPCGKEPSINAYYQLGLGRILRARLKRSGIDLDAGQLHHRLRAKLASETGDMATIDLSSASDTIASALVRYLLPVRWFNHLDDLRSRRTNVRGRWYELEKFSSMGNGFTFELETVIFLAVCMACYPSGVPGHDILVYGDDIIVPSDVCSDVISALTFFGFTTNPAKTFFEGPFRESCGGDYFLGVDVRPYQLKELPSTPIGWIGLINGLWRVFEKTQDERVLRSRSLAISQLPQSLRKLRGPAELGDIVIHDVPENWQSRIKHSIRYFRCVRPTGFKTVKLSRFCADTLFAGALYGISPHPPTTTSTTDDRGLVLRGPGEGYSVGWVPYS